MLVPKLRFKREDGTEYPEWKKSKVSELFEISAGGDIDKENSTKEYSLDYPYAVYANALTNKGLYGYANYFKVDKECFTVTGRGDVGYAVARHEKFVPIVRLLVCIPKHDENVDCFAEIINNTEILVESTGVPQLTSIQLGKIEVQYPVDLEEQKKIADFFSDIDEIITQSEMEVSNLEQQKKAAIQKIFSQQVRFKREDGTTFPEWEERQLDTFCDIITKQTGFDYTKTIKRALLSNKQDNTLPYLQTKNFSGVDFNYLTDYYIPVEVANQFNKIVLDRKCLLFSIVGASVGNIALFPNEVKCFLSGAICVAKPTIEEQTAFLYYYMCSEGGQSQIKNATKGSGQATVTIEDIRLFKIATPCPEEQQKIADFLSDYDKAIISAKKELEKWKELKKGLLQQMLI